MPKFDVYLFQPRLYCVRIEAESAADIKAARPASLLPDCSEGLDCARVPIYADTMITAVCPAQEDPCPDIG